MAVLSLNGVDLTRWTVARGTFYRPPVTNRRTVVNVGRRHGVIPVGLPVFDEPKVTLKFAPGVPVGTLDVDALEELDAELMGLLSSPELVLRRHVGSSVQEADVVLESATPEDEGFRFGAHSRWTVTLAVPGVFLRGISYETATVTGFDWGTAPVADGRVRFGPGTVDPNLTDAKSGTGVSWAGTVPTGRYLFIDAASLKAWTSTSTTDWLGEAGTDVSSAVDYPVAGPLQLWPHTTSTVGGGVQRGVQVSGSSGWAVWGRSAWL